MSRASVSTAPGRKRRQLRRVALAASLAAVSLAPAASPADAAVTIGQLAPGIPPTFCNTADHDWVQPTITSGSSYVVPAAGVVTSWSHSAAVGMGQMLTMKIFRKVADPQIYTVVGHEGPHSISPGTLNTFPASIAVQPGDVLGVNSENAGAVNNACLFSVPGETAYFRPIGLGDGQSGGFTPDTGGRVNATALVEPDCDGDGLGDETQDTNLSSCAPGTIPPPAPGGTPVTCKGLPATIVGTDGNDARTGSLGRDVIAGLGGNDTLSGLAGNDVICGGAGKDTLKGGKGKDSLLGQKGEDALKGGGGRDLCKGGKGTDTASKCEVEKSI
jgi:RTX calcium-binding nonapeptide repeat (4 copies)